MRVSASGMRIDATSGARLIVTTALDLCCHARATALAPLSTLSAFHWRLSMLEVAPVPKDPPAPTRSLTWPTVVVWNARNNTRGVPRCR